MRRNKYILPVAIIAFIAVVLVGYSLLHRGQSTENTFTDTTGIAGTVPFKIYQPSDLPNGYVAEKDYAVSNGDVISFSVKTPSGNKAVVTQQARPAEINSSSFSGLRINTPVGKATISSSPEGTSAAVITDAGTLILVSSTAVSIESEIKTILSSL